MTKVTTFAEGNFYAGFGGRLYLERNDKGFCTATFNRPCNPYRNGSYDLVETVPAGFRPSMKTHTTATVYKNGKRVPGASVRFAFDPSGKISVTAQGMSDSLGKIELEGNVTWQVIPSDWNK